MKSRRLSIMSCSTMETRAVAPFLLAAPAWALLAPSRREEVPTIHCAEECLDVAS
jgi:hypothetical protein